MRFIIQRDRLVQSVQDVMKAVTSRTTIPILTGIKIVADDEGVTLTGSDSDISIESLFQERKKETKLSRLSKKAQSFCKLNSLVKSLKNCRLISLKWKFKANFKLSFVQGNQNLI